MTHKKPLGVTAIAVYAAFSGVLFLLTSIVSLLVTEMSDGEDAAIFAICGVVLMLLGVFFIAAVYGLWTLQDWGRKLAQWLFAMTVVLNLALIFPILPQQEFTATNAFLQIISAVFSVLIVFYLSQARVKALFATDVRASFIN